MIGLIAATLAVGAIIYLLVKQCIWCCQGIPGPRAWPLVYHAPYFIGNKDEIGMRKKWAEEFRDEGLYRTRTIYPNQDAYSLLKPEYVKKVLLKPDLFERGGALGKVLRLMQGGLLDASGEEHRFQKKLLAKAFSKTHMEFYMPVFNRHVGVLIDKWKKEINGIADGKKLNVREYTCDMAFDVISDAAFGYSSCSQMSGSKFVGLLKNTIEGVIMNAIWMALIYYLPFLKRIPYGPGKAMLELEEASIELMNKVICDRKEKTEREDMSLEEKNDILSLMLSEREEETNGRLSDESIRGNIFTFFFGGHETTATSIPTILLMLSKHQDVQEKARCEIRDILGSKEELSMEDTNAVPYTVACIKETLRLLPTVPINGRICNIDMKFGKYTVPKGSVVYFESFVLNSYGDDFDDSLQFRPERYLENSGMKTGTSFTFGWGSYSCIGRNFALMEIKVAIIRMLQNFKFTIDDGDDVRQWGVGISLKPEPKIMIRVTPL